MKSALLQKLRSSRGFTMIELLIVIAILGILAVAVLAAINPVEQINRGRDTGNRSDAEQLINALDRYNAFHGFEAFQLDGDSSRAVPITTQVSSTTWNVTDLATCPVTTRLGTTLSTAVGCENSEELKESFITKVSDPDYNTLFVYNAGTVGVGTATYVCFEPRSNAFRTEAATRCGGVGGPGLPADLQGAAATVCAAGTEMICLP